VIGRSDAFIELNQVRAQPEENVLAVVHNFTGSRMFVGRGAAAEKRTLFKERNPQPCIGQRASRGKSGEAASGDGNSRRSLDHELVSEL
jgi:hypothetical protein